MRVTLTMITMLALSASGCAIVNGVDEDAFFVSDIAVRLFDGFELGADAATVRQLFGEPDQVDEGDFGGFVFVYGIGSGTLRQTELAIWFYSSYDSRAGLIVANLAYSVVTVEGIGIGASSSTVASVLGKAYETEERNWGRCSGDLFLGQGSAGLCFGYDSTGHVDRISFTLPRSTISPEA